MLFAQTELFALDGSGELTGWFNDVIEYVLKFGGKRSSMFVRMLFA